MAQERLAPPTRRPPQSNEIGMPTEFAPLALNEATVPSIGRRIAALSYEALLLLALVLVMSFPIAGLKGATLGGIPQVIFQIYLAAVVFAYFTWFWRHGGQTLPMKTWRFKVVAHDGGALLWQRASLRFVFAALFYGPAAAGIMMMFFPNRISPLLTMWTFLPLFATLFWARFDADRQFLHDRWAGTRLVDATIRK
jgi:uncharacterized RDD family membrane protein YckC